MTVTRRIIANMVILTERFAHSRSLGPVQRQINTLYTYVLEDPTSRQLVLEIDTFIRRVLTESGYVLNDECMAQGQELWSRLSAWLSNEVYAAQWNAMWHGVSQFLGFAPGLDGDSDSTSKLGSNASNWFSDEPLTRELETRWTAFTESLLMDNDRVVFKRSMWSDLGRLFCSAVNWRGLVTLPRVELVSPNVELVLENLHLSLANVFPTVLDLRIDDRVRFSPFRELQSTCAAATKTRIVIRGQQVQADVRNALVALKFVKLNIFDKGLGRWLELGGFMQYGLES